MREAINGFLEACLMREAINGVREAGLMREAIKGVVRRASAAPTREATSLASTRASVLAPASRAAAEVAP
jgi:hypothetical protein